MSKLKLRVDTAACIGAGRCVAEAPGVFDQGEDDGIVILLQETLAEEDYKRARAAVALCPAQAIRIEEDEG